MTAGQRLQRVGSTPRGRIAWRTRRERRGLINYETHGNGRGRDTSPEGGDSAGAAGESTNVQGVSDVTHHRSAAVSGIKLGVNPSGLKDLVSRRKMQRDRDTL